MLSGPLGHQKGENAVANPPEVTRSDIIRYFGIIGPHKFEDFLTVQWQ